METLDFYLNLWVVGMLCEKLGRLVALIEKKISGKKRIGVEKQDKAM